MGIYQEKGRILYLDILRILAIFLVLFTHTGTRGNHVWTITESPFERNISLIADCFRCIQTQLFMMISGALLLGKAEPWNVVYKKRIPRILVVLLISSVFYYLFWGYDGGVPDMLLMIYTSQTDTPLWYLYYYISLLLVLPFMRKMAQGMDEGEFRLFVFLSFFSLSVLPMLYTNFGIPHMNSQLSFWFCITGIVYCFTGYYLSKRNLNTLIIIILGSVALGFLLLGSYTNLKIWNENDNSLTEAGYGMATYPLAVFVFAATKKIRFEKLPDKIKTMIKTIGECVFGIYIFGDVLLVSFRPFYDAIVQYMSPLIAVNFYLIVIVTIGTIGVYILRKVPLVRKYI